MGSANVDQLADPIGSKSFPEKYARPVKTGFSDKDDQVVDTLYLNIHEMTRSLAK
jgi:hypothetical protein